MSSSRYNSLLAAGLIAVVISGCATARQTNTARSAVEQMLISSAVDQALNKIDFTPFAGANVYLEEKYVDCQDKAYVIASVRHRILAQGARLASAADKADIVIEMRSGSLGTDNSESFVGTPEVVLPGMMTLPEIKFLTNNKQTATAKIGLVAYDYRTNTVLGSGGTTLAVADDSRWTVMGFGLPKSGSIHQEIANATSGTNKRVESTLPAKVAFQPRLPDGVQYASGEEGIAVPVPPPAEEPATIRPAANWWEE